MAKSVLCPAAGSTVLEISERENSPWNQTVLQRTTSFTKTALQACLQVMHTWLEHPTHASDYCLLVCASPPHFPPQSTLDANEVMRKRQLPRVQGAAQSETEGERYMVSMGEAGCSRISQSF